jgi:hypothetical protein
MPRLLLPTPGTRAAAWMFPALTLWLGCGYLFGPMTRVSSPAFDAAKSLLPMRVWGAVFLTTALVKVVCILYSRPRALVVAMCFGMGLYACWGVLFLASMSDPRTSWGAPAWPFFVVGMHVAFMATMRRSDVLR